SLCLLHFQGRGLLLVAPRFGCGELSALWASPYVSTPIWTCACGACWQSSRLLRSFSRAVTWLRKSSSILEACRTSGRLREMTIVHTAPASKAAGAGPACCDATLARQLRPPEGSATEDGQLSRSMPR